MSTENKVKIQLTEENKNAIETAIKTLQDTFKPILVSVPPAEKRAMLTLGNKSLGFVSQNMMYAKQKAEFVPSYLDMNEWEIDLKAWEDLAPYYAQIQEIQSLLSDTISICGNEAYRQSLTYYNTVKQGAKDNVPGAKPIFDELKQYYVHPKKNKEEDKTEE